MLHAGNPRRIALAVLATAAFGAWQTAGAVGTAANTTVSNQSTVNYSVGGVAQTPIESSPTGNSTPGGGAPTTFVVDNRIDLTVTEVSGGNTPVTPGQTNQVTAFTVTNTGNGPQGYQLTPTNLTGGAVFGNTDNTDVANLRVFVDSNANGTYDAGVDTATAIDTLAADANVVVFIVADVPAGATNGQFANVQLSARAAVPGTNGATLATETTGADTPGAVDTVFGDAARDATEVAADQYAVSSAALTVTKTSAVTQDPHNGVTNPKAIPGAFVEYAVAIANTGAAAATGLQITDPLPANTTFRTGAYNGGASDVSITVGANPATFCVAEAGADTNSDGCSRTATDLVVGAPALTTVAIGAGNAVTVRFQVTIN
ncbi:MAG: hypothetical protein CMLOHMNK_00781 [Steroidobacteraceae bacterium]|nr:hypothetical protein [Steroidobacteraceae bacterium]